MDVLNVFHYSHIMGHNPIICDSPFGKPVPGWESAVDAIALGPDSAVFAVNPLYL